MFLFSSFFILLHFCLFLNILCGNMNASSGLRSQNGLETIQAQLRNSLRLCQKHFTQYHELMEESLGILMDYANTVTRLT